MYFEVLRRFSVHSCLVIMAKPLIEYEFTVAGYQLLLLHKIWEFSSHYLVLGLIHGLLQNIYT